MPYNRPAIKARPPWPEGTSPAQDRGEECPRQEIVYRCERACVHDPLSRSFAADIKPPPAIWCRCGGVARREGAPPDSQPDDDPGNRREIREGMSYVRERRSPKDLDELLAERMAEIRDSGVAR